MTVNIKLAIDVYGNYVFSKPNGGYQNPKGHISLDNESQPVEVAITLDNAACNLGYAFTGNNALGISSDPATKKTFNGDGGDQFFQLSVSKKCDKLTFHSKKDDGNYYYYQLNFEPVPGLLSYIDPILINKL